jgi:ADP-dependent NAD(P)H-hydrate dehydratase
MPLINVSKSLLLTLPPRTPDSHKGTFGHALLVGGSRGMSGSISLCGLATLRSGAGLVTIATPRAIQDVVAGFSPCYMTVGLAAAAEHVVDEAAEEVLELAEKMTAVALGPGLGRTPGVTEFVARLYREVKQPMIVDADALNGLAERKELLTQAAGPRILTPHPGEFERLTGKKPASDDDSARSIAASELAAASGSYGSTIVVLKGHRTIVSDGARYAVNDTGNPGMATGGTGDVLTGIITALVCQGLEPFEAARLGAHVHGAAGDVAATIVGEVSLIASDLIDVLSTVFLQLGMKETSVAGFGGGYALEEMPDVGGDQS